MADAGPNKYRPACMLSHEFANDLSVIIGNCELLREEAVRAGTRMDKIEIILSVARKISDELRAHICALDIATRTAVSSQDEARRQKRRAHGANASKE